MKYLRLKILILILLSINVANAQCECQENFENGWCWGSQVDEAKEKNALYTDAYKSKDYKSALEGLIWLLENAPCLNKSLYQNGAKIYYALAATTKEGILQLEYSEKVLEIYDARIEKFGQEATVMNYKADSGYKLMRGRKNKYEELLQIFERALELNGNKFFEGNMVAYMDLLKRYREAGNEISDEKILEIYFKIQDIIDYKSGTSKPVKQTTVESIETLLLQIGVELDCELVISDFGPKLDAKPEPFLARKIFKLMLAGKCADHPLALKAAIVIDDTEPSYGMKTFIGGRKQANRKFDEAIQYYTDAISLTDENAKKADLYLKMAKTKRSQGLKSRSREYAMRALNIDASMKDAHKLIGDLYMTSFEDCARKKDAADRVRDRLVFIAARDAYQKAGDNKSVSKAKAQFPSKVEVFEANEFKVGQTLQVDCWINKPVTLDTRD